MPADTMTPERWQSVKAVLATALELDAAEREHYLTAACAGDPALALEVERLLRANDMAGAGFLSGVPLLEDDENPCVPDAWIGRTLGAYRIVERLGGGGMGNVYRAIRVDDEYHADVAIKVVRDEPGAMFVARFKAERQILAGLQHPNIARLLDGGTTPEGIPYFVMELIAGAPITEFCDRRALPVDARLRLFLSVCSAVDYAHHRLVVHRDIKPGNILVTGEGVPKLLDFGIARVLGATSDGALTLTSSGPWLLTPAYASPEQLRGEDITTASDVYSLGLVLYELLTGARAIPLRTTLPHEAARILLETAPLPPSAAAPARLRRRLAGDLDTLVLKAIRKDPCERYASVEQLAADIGRHLQGRPIEARKDTRRYRLVKFVRRNAVAVAVAAAVLVIVTAAIAVAVRAASVARAERVRAEQRVDDLRQLARANLFELHDAIEKLPGSAAARNLLIERTLQYLDRLNGDSGGRTRELQEELAVGYERIGQLQGNFSGPGIGDSRAALASFVKAVAIRQALVAAAPRDVRQLTALGDALTNYSVTLQVVGRTADAADAARRALQATARVAQLRPSDPEALTAEAGAHVRLAAVIGGMGSSGSTREIATAIDHDRRALALLATIPSAAADARVQREVEDVQLHLGFHLAKARAFDESVRVFDGILAADRARPVLDAGDRMLVHNYRGLAFERAGEDARALADYEADLALTRAALAAEPGDLQAQINVAIARADVAVENGRLGQPSAGLKDLDGAIRVGERLLADDPAQLFYADLLVVGYAYQAETLSSLGDQAAAAARYAAALQMAARVSRADPQDLESPLSIAKLHAALAVVYGRAARFADAVREVTAARAGLARLSRERPADAEAAYVSALNETNGAVLQRCARGEACDGVSSLRLPCPVN